MKKLEELIRMWHTPTLKPEEIEQRVAVLELKVESNRIALEQHEQQRHPEPRDVGR